MKNPIQTALVAISAATLLLLASFADEPDPDPHPVAGPEAPSLNYKIEVRLKIGDSPEQVFRISDADGEFEADNPSPPVIFKGTLERREGKAYVLKYDCAWRQNIKEAPRDPKRPENPKGKGSFEQGGVRGKARIAKGHPVDVFEGKDSKVTITLLEEREIPDSKLRKAPTRLSKRR